MIDREIDFKYIIKPEFPIHSLNQQTNFSRSLENFAPPLEDLAFPDRVFVDTGVDYPEGSSKEDLLDALEEAKRYIGVRSGLIVFLRRQVDPDQPYLLGQASGNYISLGVDVAKEVSQLADLFSYRPAPARVQLWATAFEEALHCLRRTGGLSSESYFNLPKEPTDAEYLRYLFQPEEVAVDLALNSGVLEKKFGPTVFRAFKVVWQPSPIMNYFSLLENNFTNPFSKLMLKEPQPRNILLRPIKYPSSFDPSELNSL